MTNWNGGARVALAATFAVCSACGGAPRPSSPDAAVYEMTFQGTWTRDSHPTDYPDATLVNLGGPHFTDIVGAPHAAGYFLFREGVLATEGLSVVAHTGSHGLMEDELADAAMAGAAGEVFTTGPFIDVNAPQSLYFEVSDRFPLVSFATMLAPSSDWFTGLADVDLRENGQWVRSRSVQAYAWDSGTYEGATYSGPEQLTAPPQPVALSDAAMFRYGESRPPIATITFERIYGPAGE